VALIAALDDIGQHLYVDLGWCWQFTDMLRRSGSVINFESRAYRKGRSVIWISGNAQVVGSQDGSILYCEGTAEDIIARKNYQ
jgi:PAS domain-containing protein